MRVSFVVPTRNHAPWIRRCLDSCLAQGLPDAELLVADALSTDGTQEILASYRDRVSWRSEKDAGQGDAVNKLVARATGDVIAWINSDDYYADERALPAVLEVFEREPMVDIVYGDARVVTAGGEPLRRYWSRDFASARDVIVAPIGPPQPATFFRRQVFLDAGGLRTELHYALDYELWLRMFRLARGIRRVPRTLACMAFHPDAKSTYAMLPQIREAAAAKRAAARENGLGPLDRIRIELGVGMNLAYWAAVRTGLRRAT
jgi:glycosyltransferase involved in cell wall biosynthesis